MGVVCLVYYVRGKKMWGVIVVIGMHLGRRRLYLVLLFWNVWDYLENNIFYSLKHKFMERC